MSKYKLVTVVGNVGVGKSTLVDLLAEELPAKKVPADDLFKINPFFPLAVKDRARWSLASDLWFLKERVKMARKIPRYLEKAHVVVDSGLPMSFVYAHSRLGSGYFTNDEWELYKSIHDELMEGVVWPDVVVYLRAPVEFLRARIEERGREFEVKFHAKEYLKSLEESLSMVAKKLKFGGVKVVEVEVAKKDFVGDNGQIEQLIEFYREQYGHGRKVLGVHGDAEVQFGLRTKVDGEYTFNPMAPDDLEKSPRGFGSLGIREKMRTIMGVSVSAKAKGGREYCGYSLYVDGEWLDPSVLVYDMIEELEESLGEAVDEYSARLANT